MSYKIVKAKELKAGDIIVDNYRLFLINKCGFGAGAGSFDGFGEYFWIIGEFVNGEKKEVSFWSFQECPVIKCVKRAKIFSDFCSRFGF